MDSVHSLGYILSWHALCIVMVYKHNKQQNFGRDKIMNQVIELFPKETMSKIRDEKAEREMMDYLLWTMKFDCDPHELYDDPIAVFREEHSMKVNNKSAYVA